MKRLPYVAAILAAVLLVAADPKSAADFIKQGDSLYTDGKYDSAIAHYTKAIELLPGVEELKRGVSRLKGLRAYNKKMIRMHKSKRQSLVEQLKSIDKYLDKAKSNPDPKLILLKKRLQEQLSGGKPHFDQLKKQIDEVESKVKEPLRQSVEAYKKRGDAWKKNGESAKSEADFKIVKLLKEQQEEAKTRKERATHVVVGEIGSVYESTGGNFWSYIVSLKVEKIERDKSKSLKQGNTIYFRDWKPVGFEVGSVPPAGPWVYHPRKEWYVRMYLQRNEDGIYKYVDYEVLEEIEVKEHYLDTARAIISEIVLRIDHFDKLRQGVEKQGKKDKLSPLSGDKVRQDLLEQLKSTRKKLIDETSALRDILQN